MPIHQRPIDFMIPGRRQNRLAVRRGLGLRAGMVKADRDHAPGLRLHHRGCPEAARRTTPVEP